MSTKTRSIVFWVATILGPASFVISGDLHLSRDPQVMATLAHLGYPPSFATIIGAWKLLGAIAIVGRPAREPHALRARVNPAPFHFV